ncbi:acyl-CoA dehydrogenase, partial [Mycobacterium tuberculosis]
PSVLHGSPPFLPPGLPSALVLVVAPPAPAPGAPGFRLLVVARGLAGFARGRPLAPLGLAAPAPAALSFPAVAVPAAPL